MTITRTTASAMFDTDGLTTEFPFEFALAVESDLVVQLISAESVVTTVPETDYTVTVTGAEEGVVELNVAPAAGQKLYLYRTTSLTQQVAVAGQTGYDPVVVQKVWDKLTMMSQDIATVLGRSIVAPPGVSQADYFDLIQSYALSAGNDAGVAQAAALAAAASALAAQEKENSMLRDRGAWEVGILYTPSDLMTDGNRAYITNVTHISSNIGDDITAGNIRVFANQGAAGSGSGDMLKSENLSGLTDYAMARGNMGLGSLATRTPTGSPTSETVLFGDRWDVLPEPSSWEGWVQLHDRSWTGYTGAQTFLDLEGYREILVSFTIGALSGRTVGLRVGNSAGIITTNSYKIRSANNEISNNYFNFGVGTNSPSLQPRGTLHFLNWGTEDEYKLMLPTLAAGAQSFGRVQNSEPFTQLQFMSSDYFGAGSVLIYGRYPY